MAMCGSGEKRSLWLDRHRRFGWLSCKSMHGLPQQESQEKNNRHISSIRKETGLTSQPRHATLSNVPVSWSVPLGMFSPLGKLHYIWRWRLFFILYYTFDLHHHGSTKLIIFISVENFLFLFMHHDESPLASLYFKFYKKILTLWQ